mgnify:CR=1 FL=1
MSRFALLFGSAPEGHIQKKVDGMYDFLSSQEGGSYGSDELMVFPNGLPAEELCEIFSRLSAYGVENLYLYVCTIAPTFDSEESVWLGGNEVKKEALEKPETNLLCGTDSPESTHFSVQLVYDSDREFISAENYFLG